MASRRYALITALWIAIAGCEARVPAEPPSSPAAATPAPAPRAPEPSKDPPPTFETSGLPQGASLRIRGSFSISGHGAELALAPSGRRLAISRGLAVDVIDLDARPPQTLRVERPGSRIEAVAFSPDGARLAVGFSPWDSVGGGEASVRLFDVESGREVQRLEGARVLATTLAFSADGRRLLVAGSCVCVWNPADGKRERELGVLDPFDPIVQAVLSADGRVVVGLEEPPLVHTNEPNGVRVYTAPPSRVLRWDTGSTKPVTVPDLGNAQQLALGSDGARLLVASRVAPGLMVRELDSGREIARHPDPASTAVLSPDGRMVAVAGLDHRIRLLSFPDLRDVGVLGGHPPRDIYALAFSQDRRRLVSMTPEEILVWALDAGAAP